MVEREKLKKLAEEATSGDWQTRGLSDHVRIERRNEVGYLNIARCGSSKPGPHEPDGTGTWANAKFIAAANPSTILALLSELEAAERERGHYKEIADKMLCVTLPQPMVVDMRYKEQAEAAETALCSLKSQVSELWGSGELDCGPEDWQGMIEQSLAKMRALRTLRQASQRAKLRLESDGPKACTCKLEGFVGGPIPCVTCQTKAEISELAAALAAEGGK